MSKRSGDFEEYYDWVAQISRGTTSTVFRAVAKDTKEAVVVKRIHAPNHDMGFPANSMREITILKQVDHPNVVHLREILISGATKEVCLILDAEDCDLSVILKKGPLSRRQARSVARQLASALDALKARRILHRDVKPANILVTGNSVIRLADFSSARWLDATKGMTNEVVTLWYRAPELLLGRTQYGYEVDMWSLGCVLFEMMTGKVLFRAVPSLAAADQLSIIIRTHGLPDAAVLEFWKALPAGSLVEKLQGGSTDHFPQYLAHELGSDTAAVDLVGRMLEYDAVRRIDVREVLSHPFVAGAEPPDSDGCEVTVMKGRGGAVCSPFPAEHARLRSRGRNRGG